MDLKFYSHSGALFLFGCMIFVAMSPIVLSAASNFHILSVTDNAPTDMAEDQWSWAFDHTEENADVGDWEEYEQEIRDKIKNTIEIVAPVYNPYVRSYLRTYLDKNPERTQEMLGRGEVYFPIFERMLAEEGLPDQLKYLAVVESALVNYATSRSGAVGLWQFMKPTAREYGLKITSYVDERMDTEKATRAAVKYLKYLYKRFGTWELAMAAYNAGPGRVRSAIRRSGTKDFWKLYKYLPRETRAYVPGFIAATYVYNYHADHGLYVVDAGSDWDNLAKIRIHKGVSFREISDVTGVPYNTVKKLNTKFFRNFIPQTTLGQDIFLPDYATSSLLDYLDRPDGVAVSYHNFRPIAVNGARYEEKEIAHPYFVRSGDNLYTLARNNGTSVRQIQDWNGLKSSKLRIGQRLVFYTREMILVSPPKRQVRTVANIPVKANVKNYRTSHLDLSQIEWNMSPSVMTSQLISISTNESAEKPQMSRMVIQRRHGLNKQLMRAGIQNPDAILEQNGITPSDVKAGRVVKLWE